MARYARHPTAAAARIVRFVITDSMGATQKSCCKSAVCKLDRAPRGDMINALHKRKTKAWGYSLARRIVLQVDESDHTRKFRPSGMGDPGRAPRLWVLIRPSVSHHRPAKHTMALAQAVVEFPSSNCVANATNAPSTADPTKFPQNMPNWLYMLSHPFLMPW